MTSFLHKILFVVFIILVLIVSTAVYAYNVPHLHARPPLDVDVSGGGVFRLKVSEPEYSAVKSGKKTVEARLDRPPFDKLSAGDPVLVVRSRPAGDTTETPGYKFEAEVARVKKYKNITALLKEEGVDKVYPGKTADQGAKRFAEFVKNPADDPAGAVVAIELKAASHGQVKGAARVKRGGCGCDDGDSYGDADSDDSYGDY
jgi:ASC-1-like (ASCH) protein